MDGMLSQEEINALLSGMDQSDNSSDQSITDPLSVEEKDAIGEISNISMGTAATTLSTLVNNKVVITTPVVSYTTLELLSKDYDRPCVFIQISYKEGLDGTNILVLKESDVKIITDLMMGGDGTNVSGELSDLHLSAISEAMNQMMGSAATSISSMLEKKVDISPPTASLIDLNDTIDDTEISAYLGKEFVMVSFKMEIGNLVDSQIMQLYPSDFAKDLYKKFIKSDDNMEQALVSNSAKEPVKEMPQQPVNQQMNQQMQPQMMNQQMMNQQMPMQGMQMPYMGQSMMAQGMPMQGNMPYGMPMQDVNVQPAQFQSFSGNVNPIIQTENIDLIMDVPLEVTVELGRTNKSIKEILDFSPGTIIELDKLAGEPIDVLVNGKFVAKGEVVVIEENFGIRVTEIIR
jgi:flagellar motor switch protein FliN